MAAPFLLLLSIIFLSLGSGVTNALDTSPFRRACEETGGFFESETRCVCYGDARAINPLTGTCLEANLKVVNQLLGTPEVGGCQNILIASGGDANLKSFDNIDKACSEPAFVFCSVNENPSMNHAVEAHRLFRKLEDQALDTPEMREWLLKINPSRPPRRCYQIIPDDGHSACYTRLNDTMRSMVFTPERQTKAREIFEGARSTARKVLEDRMALARTQGMPRETFEFLDAALKRLSATKLSMDFVKEPRWNAAADGDASEEGKVHLEGMILLVDQNPGALYNILLHELGHRVGPSLLLLGQTYNSRFPFNREIRCLIPDSLISGPECYERHAQRADTLGYTQVAQSYRNAAARVRGNPIVGLPFSGSDLAYPDMNFDDPCQVPMQEEAFADWFAAEGLARLLDYSGTEVAKLRNQAIVEAVSAESCEWDRRAPRSIHVAGERRVSPLAENRLRGWSDPHPTEDFRLNRILFNHPSIREAVGCPKIPLMFPSGSPQNADEFTPRYCGPHLYMEKFAP